MNLALHPEALEEFEAAALWYEDQTPGLGDRFIEAVEEAFQRIIDHPASWPFLEDDVRRVLTRVFPYAVLYTVEPDGILVVAVMHCHRQPGYWRERLA